MILGGGLSIGLKGLMMRMLLCVLEILKEHDPFVKVVGEGGIRVPVVHSLRVWLLIGL